MKAKDIIILFAALLAWGCDSKENQQEQYIEIGVTLGYTLPQSGSMTKGSADVYDAFYNAQIVTHNLTPDPYEISFLDKNNKPVATLAGKWSENALVRLPVGSYHVQGTSSGGSSWSDSYKKASLYFDEDITVNLMTTSIILHAQYDCFLLLFDAAGKSNAEWTKDGSWSASYDNGYLSKVDNLYYLFAQEFGPNGFVRWYSNTTENKIMGAAFNFQKGCYYYFNDLTSTFDIPKMQQGTN